MVVASQNEQAMMSAQAPSNGQGRQTLPLDGVGPAQVTMQNAALYSSQD